MVEDIAERSRSRRGCDDAMTGAVGIARLQTQRGIVEADVSATADEVYGTVDVAVAEIGFHRRVTAVVGVLV